MRHHPFKKLADDGPIHGGVGARQEAALGDFPDQGGGQGSGEHRLEEAGMVEQGHHPHVAQGVRRRGTDPFGPMGKEKAALQPEARKKKEAEVEAHRPIL